MQKLLCVLILLFSVNASLAKSLPVKAASALAANETPDQLIKTLKHTLKLQAIAMSASYIEHEQIMDGEDFQEKILSLNAAIVELKNVNSSWHPDANGVLVLEMTADADIDTSVLDVQIAQLRRNYSLENANTVMAKRLEALEKKIDDKEVSLKNTGQHGDRRRLAESRDHLVTEIMDKSTTAQLYKISPETRKRLLITQDILTNTKHADELALKIGEKLYRYFEKHLVLSAPAIKVVSERSLNVTVSYGYDPLPIIGLLEPWFTIEVHDNYLMLSPKFTEASYEKAVSAGIARYLGVKIGVAISTITKFHELADYNHSVNRGIKDWGAKHFSLYFGHGNELDTKEEQGKLAFNFKLPSGLVANLPAIRVGSVLY
jgi:hypothetical protein